MVDIFHWSFIWYFIYFIVVVLVGYYIPGSLVLEKAGVRKGTPISLSIVTGMVLLAFQGYVFGYLGVRYFSYVYIFVFLIFSLFKFWKSRKLKHFKINMQNIDWVFIVIVLIGSLVQLSTIWFTGIVKSDGNAYFCCGDPNDNLWFASITNQLIERIPPYQPGMYQVLFRNYHYWSNLIVGETSRIFRIPPFQLQFQYMTLLSSVLFAQLIWGFSSVLRLGKSYARWLAVFLYFGSDMLYAVQFFLGKPIDFTMSSLEDGVGFYANFPRALAVIVFFAFLILFVRWMERKTVLLTVLLSLFVGSLFGIKIYIGIFLLVGLCTVMLIRLFHRDLSYISLCIMSLLVALVVFFPVNSTAAGFFFTGFWRVENFAVQPALGLVRLELARKIFADAGKPLKALFFDLIFLLLYIVSLFGTKIIGCVQSKVTLRRFPSTIHILFGAGFLFSAVLGFFFVQKVSSSNTFNFIVNIFIFSSVYAALACTFLIPEKPRIIRFALIACICAIMMPRVIYRASANIKEISKNKGFYIENDVVLTSKFLKDQIGENSLIAVNPFSFYFDTNGPMFQALTTKHMFYSGEGLLEGFQAPETIRLERKEAVRKMFTSTDENEIAKTVRFYGIDYIVVRLPQILKNPYLSFFLEEVFRQNDIIVFRVKRECLPLGIFSGVSLRQLSEDQRYASCLEAVVTQ